MWQFVMTRLAGVMVVTGIPEKCYEEIVGQGWKTVGQPYMTIHRMAVSEKYRGTNVAEQMIIFAKKYVPINVV